MIVLVDQVKRDAGLCLEAGRRLRGQGDQTVDHLGAARQQVIPHFIRCIAARAPQRRMRAVEFRAEGEKPGVGLLGARPRLGGECSVFDSLSHGHVTLLGVRRGGDCAPAVADLARPLARLSGKPSRRGSALGGDGGNRAGLGGHLREVWGCVGVGRHQRRNGSLSGLEAALSGAKKGAAAVDCESALERDPLPKRP